MKKSTMQPTGQRLIPNGGVSSSAAVRYLRKNWILYLFVLPTIVWYIIFRYFPMPGVYMAFTRYQGIGDIFDAKFVGLKWFKSFFESAYAKQTLVNTLRLSLYSLALFPLPIIFAVIVNEIRNEKFKKVTQTIVYAPHFVSLVILVTMLGLFFDAKGIVNSVLTSMGMEKIRFLDSDAAYPHVFVWSGIWSSLGWSAIIYTAALSSVDPSLHEAAKLDGASRLQLIWHINLPAIAPTIIIMLLLRMGNVMGVGYEKIILLYNEGIYETADVISTFVYRKGLLDAQWSYSAAVGLFNSVTNFVIIVTMNKISSMVTEVSLW